MWPFSRRTDAAGLLDPGFTDWHCHVLPGVDDGVRTMAEALEVLEEYGRRGVAEVWLTPHIMEDIPNTTAALRERFSELQAAYSGPVRLHLAAENMLDSLFEERLESGDLLPLGPGGTICWWRPAISARRRASMNCSGASGRGAFIPFSRTPKGMSTWKTETTAASGMKG